MTDLFSKIKEVTELDGIAGYEHSVRDYLRTKITPLVDRVETDGLGGIFGIRDSKVEKAPPYFSSCAHGRSRFYGQ